MPAVPVEHYPQLLSAVTQSEKSYIYAAQGHPCLWESIN